MHLQERSKKQMVFALESAHRHRISRTRLNADAVKIASGVRAGAQPVESASG